MRSSAIRWALWGGAFAALLLSPTANAQERFSNLVGTVVDQSGAGVGDVLVTVTNNESKRTLTVTTGPDGAYYVREVEPGRYTVKFERQGFTVKEAPNVNLLLGKTIKVDTTLQVGGLQEEMQVVGETPLIDIGATQRGQNVPAEEFDLMPKGRSFQQLAATSPSVNSATALGGIEGGIQVNGSSAGENNFTVDGVAVNSLVNGHQRQDAVFEYLQEVQVKTSGLAAEYGGALGGVISAVTKSGGNEWKGSLFYYYEGNQLRTNSGFAERLVLDPATQNNAYYVQDDDQTFKTHEFGGSLGGPIVKDKLFFFGSLSPRIRNLTRTYVTGDGQGASTSADSERKTYSAFGKLTFEPTNRLRLNVSGLWSPEKSTGTTPGFNGTQANWYTGDVGTIDANRNLGYEVPQWSGSFTADYTLSSTSLLSVRSGYMRDNYFDTGVDTSQTYEYATSAVGLAGVPAQYQQPAGYQNLPRVRINTQDLTTRKFVNLELTKAFHAAGAHNMKLGGGWSRVTNDVDLSYPNGGYVTVYWDSSFTSDATGKTDRGPYGYYYIDDFGTKGVAGANLWSGFIQDNWSVTPRLTLNLGLRAEHEIIPSFRPDIQEVAIEFGWSEKLSPRVGFAYDVRGDGKLKVSGAFGRYYDWTKYEIARGSFGGDIWHERVRSLDVPDPTTLSFANLSGRNLWTDEPDSYKDLRIPGFGEDAIDPNMKPMAQDVYNLGAEYQISPNTVVGLNVVRTNLLRTIEDIGTLVNGSEAYIYANPGEGLAETAITTGLTPPFTMPKAKRNYTAMEVTVNRRFNKNWFMGGSYVLSRLEGNYPGTVNTDEIAAPGFVSVPSQSPTAYGQTVRPGTNVSRAWDLDEMMFDSHGNLGVDGLLPTDRPHVIKLYGSYQFDFGTNVGLNFYGGSGTPYSEQVQSVYRYPILVEGRGSNGRAPFLNQTDLFISHEVKLGGAKRLRFEFNALNLFDQQTERYQFSYVNRMGANGRVLASSALRLANQNLLNGYDYNALLAATPDAAKPAGTAGAGYQDPRYQMPYIFNPGFQGRLSVRFIF
jgi:hypothetical protein